MNLLLDTHIALWAITDHPRLAPSMRREILEPRNAIVVSAASIWEIAIKSSLARGGVGYMPLSGTDALEQFIRAGYQTLSITPEHAAAVERLPPLHNDPFDRLLVAQALEEPLRLVTHDSAVAAYSDTIILV
ncbi:MAG TPA: type II toxin-antitoxin system VapC family toxin [Caulobacteraceae bacterium]